MATAYFNKERELEGFRINRAVGNRLFPQQMPAGLRPGMALYRNSDRELERQLSRQSSRRSIPLAMQLGVTDDGFSLSAHGVTVDIACEHQQAEKPQHDNIVRQLSRLGGTVYEYDGVDMPSGFNYFIPSSQLAELRRRLVEALEAQGKAEQGRGKADRTAPRRASVSPFALPAQENIANRLARAFYGDGELTAYELKADDRPLMQCRHCLRYALGCCVKHGGRKPQWHEPLSLRLGDGRLFRLEFDCKHCQMNVYAAG